MRFMNEGDIRRACNLHEHHPVLGPATVFLRDFMMEVNSHSDGWPHWAPPLQAAQNMIQLIEGPPSSATEQQVTNALIPIRAFYTRRGYAAGMKLPTLAPFPSSQRPAPQMTLFPSDVSEQQPSTLQPSSHTQSTPGADRLGHAARQHRNPMSNCNDRSQANPTPQPCPETGDPESNLRALWTAKGVPEQRQNEILAEIAAKAQPGAQIGPFRLMGHPPKT